MANLISIISHFVNYCSTGLLHHGVLWSQGKDLKYLNYFNCVIVLYFLEIMLLNQKDFFLLSTGSVVSHTPRHSDLTSMDLCIGILKRTPDGSDAQPRKEKKDDAELVENVQTSVTIICYNFSNVQLFKSLK